MKKLKSETSLFKNQKLYFFITLLVFIISYYFLISQIPWHLVFLDTTIAGGDTGTHNYNAYYAFQIFPKIKWWSMDWTAGFPFLYFYPPTLYYLTSIFAHFFKINIVFKLITLLGTFLFPLALFLCLKLLGFEFPIPQIGVLLSINYLFLEQFSIYGGNLPSTLAGEFSYSLSFSLFFIFLGLFWRTFKDYLENKEISYLPLILLLSLMTIIHPFPVIMTVAFGGIVFLIEGVFKKRLKKVFLFLLKIYGLSFCLTAFWSLPFLALLPYTAKMNWTRTVNLEDIFPKSLIVFVGFALFGFIFSLKKLKSNPNFLPLYYVMLSSFLIYISLNNSSIFNARFLPFFIVGYLLLASIGLSIFLEEIALSFKKTKKVWIIGFFIVLMGFLNIKFYLPKNISYLPFWFKWNYEGFENKKTWPSIKPLFDYLKTLPYGRVMVEYRPEYDNFGTPRIFENLPIFAHQPTFEGLLTESSMSSYFHFINQAETTKRPSSAIAGFEYPEFNFENGVKHLKLFGAKYFLAYTSEVKSLADIYLKKLKEINDFNVYEIPDSQLVEVLENIELKPKTKDWFKDSIRWYKSMDFSKPIVYYQNSSELKTINEFARYYPLEEGEIQIESLSNDSLVFKTNNLYQPHLIKISYFPGWKAEGAYGPYLISPSFMMVIPFQEKVVLSYHYNLYDKIGFSLSLITLCFLITQKLFHSLKPLPRNPLKQKD